MFPGAPPLLLLLTAILVSSAPASPHAERFAELHGVPTRAAPGPLLQVRVRGKWGYASRSGELVIPAVYDQAAPFSEDGMAKVWRDGKAGLIDATGQPVFDIVYQDLGPEASPAYPRRLAGFEAEDRLGVERAWELWESRAFETWHESYFPEDRILLVRDGLFGFGDRSGNEVIPPRFTEATDFHQGKAQVSGYDNRGKLEYWLIDRDGKALTEPTNQFWHFGPEFVSLRKEGGAWWKYFDGNDYPVRVPGEFEKHGFPAGEPTWERRGGNPAEPAGSTSCWRLRAPSGEVLLDKLGDWRPFSGGLAAVQRKRQKANGKKAFMGGYAYGYVDTQGRTVIPARFENAGTFRDGLAIVQMEGKVGWIDTAGAFVWEPRD